MWQQLKIQNNDFLIKKVNNDGNYIIFVSNLIKIWSEELTTEILYKRCMKFNPLVEGERESLTKWILSLLSNESTASIKMIECDDSQVLEIKSKLSGVPFVFKFYLEPVTAEKFYQEITLPLLLMIQQLQAQKQKLFDLLQKKDVEITEYKMEGAQLSRKNIETAVFTKNQFEESCSTITIPTDIIEKPALLFTHEMQTLYANALHKYEYSKALTESAKVNTDTEDSGTQSTQSDSSPEKKRKLHEGHMKVNIKDENEERKKLEDKLLAKQRKQATKRKVLPL